MPRILSEAYILETMRSEYHSRLVNVLNEDEVFDSRGNMLLGKDLKVHHKTTGLEYTVADVFTDPEGGKIKIALRVPEDPRVDSTGEEGVITDTPPNVPLAEDEIHRAADTSDAPGLPEKENIKEPLEGGPDDEEIFVIDQAEFEKEYEVK